MTDQKSEPQRGDLIVAEIEASVAESQVELRWMALVEQARRSDRSLGPAEFRLLWENCFSQWNSGDGPAPIWLPSDNELKQSNVAIWMDEFGIRSYREFHAWTINEATDAKILKSLGVDSITTDRPAFIRNAIAPTRSAKGPCELIVH